MCGDDLLIRTGKVVRDEVANKIYEEKKIKNAKWSENEVCFRNVPTSF